MSDILLGAYIGIGGAIIGAFTSWGLQKLSSMGSVKIYVKEKVTNFYTKIDLGLEVANTDKFNYHSTHFTLDIFNSSNSKRLMLRDIKLVKDDAHLTKEAKLYFLQNKVNLISKTKLPEIDNILLSPNELKTINFNIGFDNEDFSMLNRNWFLEYKNKNNKIKLFQIHISGDYEKKTH